MGGLRRVQMGGLGVGMVCRYGGVERWCRYGGIGCLLMGTEMVT